MNCLFAACPGHGPGRGQAAFALAMALRHGHGLAMAMALSYSPGHGPGLDGYFSISSGQAIWMPESNMAEGHLWIDRISSPCMERIKIETHTHNNNNNQRILLRMQAQPWLGMASQPAMACHGFQPMACRPSHGWAWPASQLWPAIAIWSDFVLLLRREGGSY